MKNDADLILEKWEEFGLNEAMTGMFSKLINDKVMPESAREITMEKVMKKINFIKIIPEKIALLHMVPGKLPVKKIWEKGKATREELSA